MSTTQQTTRGTTRRARAAGTVAVLGAVAALGIGAASPSTATAASSSGFEVNMLVPFTAPASAYLGPACVGKSADDPERTCSQPQRLTAGVHELLVFAKSSGGAVDVLANPMTAQLKAKHCPADPDGGVVSDASRLITLQGRTNGSRYHVAVDKRSVLGPAENAAAGLFHLSVPVCVYEHKAL